MTKRFTNKKKIVNLVKNVEYTSVDEKETILLSNLVNLVLKQGCIRARKCKSRNQIKQ